MPEPSDAVAAEVRALADELERLAERTGDLAIDALRAAIAAGETSRPPIERALGRVRAALERARHLLERELDPGRSEDDLQG